MAKVTITFEDVENEEFPLEISAEFEPIFRGDEGEVPTPAQWNAIDVLTLLEAGAKRAGGEGILNKGTEFEEKI